MMNLCGSGVIKDASQPTSAQYIVSYGATIQQNSTLKEILKGFAITNIRSKYILDEISNSISCCTDVDGNLIDRKIVQSELQTLAKTINNATPFIRTFAFPARWDKLRKIYSDEFDKIATEMVYKSIRYGDHTNEELLLNAVELDKQCTLNQIPKELIDIIAMTMYEAKLNDAMIDSKKL